MMNPYISWAVLLVVAGGMGWYYNHGANAKVKAPIKSAAEKVEHITSVKKPSKKKAKKSPEPSSTRAAKEEATPTSEPKVQDPDQTGEDIDQNEMAQRFAAVKSGLPQTNNKSSKAQKKNKKAAVGGQLDANNSGRSGSHVSTRTASTNGADADDDLSPVESPVVNASVPSAGYVSDMLEAPSPGASVLRVTGSVENEPKKQKVQSFKQVETKKQRQQRLKNEERKQQVQEAEVERRKLLEKQLHQARESERREAAKSKPAPATNAWQTKNTTSGTNGNSKPVQTSQAPLLDTFDSNTAPTKPATAVGSKWASLPSEEEQMRMLQQGDDEWTTVAGKKQPKKKSDRADESQSDISASESHPAPVTAPIASKPKVTVTPTYLPDILRSKQKGHPLDSDWAA